MNRRGFGQPLCELSLGGAGYFVSQKLLIWVMPLSLVAAWGSRRRADRWLFREFFDSW